PADSTPFTTGRLYRYTTSADAFNRLAAGKHSIRVDAADARYRTAVAVPDAFELTGASIADSPVLTVNPVSPAEGANATVFTWTLNYVDVGNLGPASDYPRIYISDPSGNPVPNPSLDNAPYFLMSLLPGSGSFAEGRQYAFTRSLTTPGLYSYYVEARNTGNGYARLPAPGVIPDKIAAPRLYALPQITASGVTPTSGRLGTQFEWRATYFDADNHPPAAGYPRVTIADPKGNLLQDAANLNVPYFVMSEVDAADTTYNDPGGKVYRALVTPPASGTYTYFVEANCAGGESVRSPAVGTLSSPAVFAPPTIAIVDDAVAQGTTEAKGPIGTSFVWTISYTDADQHLPAATYPRLVITGPDGRVVTNPAANGVPYFTMGPVSPGGYQNGKLYRRTSGAELSMPGFYQYHIEVVDTGGDAARLPASGDTERPLVYRRPTLTRASVNPVAASEGTTFVWSVTYTQQDDLAPDEANDYPRLIITDPNNNVLRDPNNSKNPYAPYFVMPKLSPTATSYKDGVDYVFTRKLVDPGAYRFRIEARDTVGVAVTVPTSGDINGPAVYANPALSLPGLTPSGGPKDTSFTWSVDYTDRDNQAPKFGYPRLVIIGPSGAPLLDPSNNNAAYFPMQPVDPNDTDYVDGSRYTFTRSLSTVGAYRYHIEVVDAGEGQARLPAAGEADGPSVFVGPGFRDVVLTPAKGTPATRFSWTATYMNPDNLAPKINYPRVIITDQAGSVVLDPTNSNQPYHAARKADPSDVIFTDGVVYTVQRSLPAAGTYKYRWEVTDVGENSASVPIGGGDLTGPVVESVVNPRVTPTVGAAGNYTFMVDYFGPAGVQVNNVVATLRISGAATPPPVQMTRTGGTDAATGLTFSAVVNLTVVGDYSFYVDVSDGVATYTSATVAQPRVASPALSSVAVNPAQGIVGRGFAFTARYTHGNRLPPTQIAVKLVKPNATTVTLPMTTTDSDTTLLDGAGWLYQASAPLTDVGDYSFTVEATDGGTAVTSPSTSGPEVIGPQLSQAAVAPNTGGYAGGLFGFSVTYTYGANQAPKFVRLLLTYPDGSKPAPLEMVADPNGAPFNAGRLFTKSVALPRAGTYQYAFESSEDGSIVTAATAPAPGPTVDEPVAPTLNDPSVALTAGQTDLYTYSVLYKQAQGIQPVWVRLLIDVDAAGQARQTVTMLQEDAAATNYATGVRYVYNLSQPPTPGDHNFKILVNTGSKQVETAVLPGPSINRPPTLEPQKVTPANGDENTLFTFAAKYVDPDNDAPAYVRVSVGNKVVTLAKADANQNDYRAGVLYQAQVRLPAGPLVHTFHAADARQAVVRAPVSGTIEGPNVKPATQITVSASPAEATLDGLGSIGISGSLSPAAPKAALKVICALATTQSDGATSEEARKTLDITSDDEGKFSAAFVPDQAGAWKVRVEYAGGTEYGSGSGSANVTIKPATQPLSPGLHMLSLPAAPAGNDLRNALSGGPFDAWVFRAASEGYLAGPILPPGGPDSSPLTAPPGKGLGFWMKSPASLTATVGGRLNDHAQPVAIDVHDGWNLLGSPFLAATSWASAQFETRGRRMSLEEARATGEARAHAWTWDSARNEYRLLDATTPGADRDLAPWQGVWFRSSGAGKLVLAAPSTGSRQPAAARSDRTPRSEREWSIRLVASNGAQRDSFNYAGVTSEGRAAAGSALESPPPARNAVDLYFTGPGADGRYATDFRSPAAGPQTWDMVVETDVLDRLITVSVPDLTRLPNNLVAYLEDPDAGGKRVYLRTAGGYTFSPGETGRRHLRLVVQPRDAGSLLVSDITLQPARGGRAIGYALSRAAAVTVEILSPSWKRVAVVADRQPAAAGRASVVWDGRRVDGVSVPAGLYIVQVTASAEDQQTARAIKLITITR
ncbi:MAG: hypothetical protein HY321_16195, partial [Armatimonadetes bacterium]|nr:hypothetical protein [Armatimonadota bacterium]